MTTTNDRGLTGAFGAPPGTARKSTKKKPTKKRAAATTTSARGSKPTSRARAATSPSVASPKQRNGMSRRTTSKPRVLEAPTATGVRTRRSVRIPVSYIRRCAIIKGHLGLSQGDILMAAYTEWGASILDEPADFVEQWSRRRSANDAVNDGRENLQPLLTAEERAAVQHLVDLTEPAGSWPKVVVELLDRHLPTLERHL